MLSMLIECKILFKQINCSFRLLREVKHVFVVLIIVMVMIAFAFLIFTVQMEGESRSDLGESWGGICPRLEVFRLDDDKVGGGWKMNRMITNTQRERGCLLA